MEEQPYAFGPHLTVDLKLVPYEIQTSLQLHYDFLFCLPGIIGMTLIDIPKVFPYEGLVPEDRGITGTAIIAQSHISAHSFERKGWTFIDVFSCVPFNVNRCMDSIRDTFKPGDYVYEVRQRGIGFPR